MAKPRTIEVIDEEIAETHELIKDLHSAPLFSEGIDAGFDLYYQRQLITLNDERWALLKAESCL